MEQFANLVETTLNGAIIAGATSLVVTSATGFPGTGNFRLNIENEIFEVTARAGTTCTVVPGTEGTAQAPHANGAIIAIVLTAAAMNTLVQSVNAGTNVTITGTSQNPIVNATVNSGWFTALDLDFTAQASQTLAPDGNYTIGGFVWTKANSAKDVTATTLTAGTGILMNPAASNISPANGPNGPVLFLPFSQIPALANIDWDYKLRLYVSLASQVTTNTGDFVAVGFINAPNSTVYGMLSTRGQFGGTIGGFAIQNYINGAAFGTQAVSVGQALTTASLTFVYDIGALYAYPTKVLANGVLAAGTAFPAFNTFHPYIFGTVPASVGGAVPSPTFSVAPSSFGIVLAMASQVGGATSKATFQRIRLDYAAG